MMFVAPFTGAWIEINHLLTHFTAHKNVAPFTGAWIEIAGQLRLTSVIAGRTLHGCVD